MHECTFKITKGFSVMDLYLAPLEGITGYIFRNAVNDYFGRDISKYFTPFIEPHIQKKNLTHRELNDILPEHNNKLNLIPQIMTNSSEAFLLLEKEIERFGYRELNINLGCPSPTVTSKYRGSGLLSDPDRLDRMLDSIFANTKCEISVKTRIGYSDPEEWQRILEIYNKYPLKELIIHPRVRDEFYQGEVHMDAFLYALRNSSLRICYNGDINSTVDFINMKELCLKNAGKLPDAVMCGRGMITNPKLLQNMFACNESISNDLLLSPNEALSFTDRVLNDYLCIMSGETPALHKMKEIWSWMAKTFPDSEKGLKKLLKAKNITEYNKAVRTILHIK